MSRFSLRLLPSALVLSVAVLCATSATAQDAATPAQDTAVPAAQAPATDTLSNTPSKKKTRLTKEEKKDNRIVATKDTKKAEKKAKKNNPLAGVDVNLPDKQLFDKAMLAMQRNHFDVARLDLQTLLNTYPDSQFQMRAKLAIGDSWYKEGGEAALTQAEQEYKDFITFFPNQPEAAEAQMKVANIYFREMDRPDRDYQKAVRAQEEYRNMIQQFPESTLVPEAKQKLREVQEVLATRESSIAQYYGSHQNWAAAIARYQTVADTYPLYSRMDDTLLGLGDAYAAQAKLVATMRLPEGPKGRLEKIYTDQAAAMYDRLLTVYPAAAHTEDAKDRLTALGYPIPKPTAEQLAASETLENSRTPYTLKRRAKLMVMHSPDTVSTAQAGEPTMADPPSTDAPKIIHEDIADVRGVMDPANANTTGPIPGGTGSDALASAAPATDASGGEAAADAPAAAPAPLTLEDVPTVNSAPTSGAAVTSVPVAPASGTNGNSVGAEVVPSGTVTGSTEYPGNSKPDDALVKPVGNTTDAALPPVEAPADSPDAINDIKPGSQAPVPATNPNAKPVKAPYDAKDESSSKHKKKKGLDKLNPF